MADQNTILVPDAKPLNQVKYAAKDYQSLFDELLRRLKVLYSEVYNDYATTSVGIMLTQLMSYSVSQLNWYLDRTASDCFLETARTRAAVARLVKQIGYKMSPATAASTKLNLVFPDSSPGPFTMDAYWRFLGTNGLQYESYADKVFATPPDPNTTYTLDVRQGETQVVTFTADGTKNQRYTLSAISTDRFLADQSVRVWVDGQEWAEVPFLEFEKTNQYEVGYVDDPPTIQFGDGKAGNIPADGSEIRIQFLIIDGKGGDAKTEVINTSLDKLIVLGQDVKIEAINPLPASGGNDPEDIEHAKKIAPFYFAARGAAITLPDYLALTTSYSSPEYGRVAQSYAINPRTAYEDAVFNQLIFDLETEVANYVATVTPIEQSTNAQAAELTTSLGNLNDDLTDLSTIETDVTSSTGSARANVEGARNIGLTTESDLAIAEDDLTDQVSELDDAIQYIIDNFATWTATERDQVVADLTEIRNSVSADRDIVGNSRGSVGSMNNSLSQTLSFLNEISRSIETVTPEEPEFSLHSKIVEMTAETASMDTVLNDPTTGMVVQLSSLVGLAEALEVSIHGYTGDMHTRIGELFNDDCLSNFVQVPILSVDTNGDYIAPSVGLIKGLQDYLDGVKEVTHHVEVTDGSPTLLGAVIEIGVKVKEAFVESEVLSQVESATLDVLRGRDYNVPLYLHELHDTAKAASNGFEYVNIKITGPAGSLDTEGNLVPLPNQVIVDGGLTVSAL